MIKTPSGRQSPVRILSILALAFLALYVFGLSALYGRAGGWLIDDTGQPRSNEFVGVRAAGKLALEGRAAGAYDWKVHEAATAAVLGHPVGAYFPYPYPPPYFFVAAVLALLPYLLTALTWIGATLALYAWSVSRIAGARVAALWSIASPASAFNAFVAHTSFWTAAVMGLALDALPARPVLAGALLAALAVKPQFGLLVPVALLAGGHWRAIGSACAATALLALLSAAVFGSAPWFAFPAQMASISNAARFGHERIGEINYDLLVTAYGLARATGLPDAAAIAAQGVLAVLAAAFVALLWRSTAPHALKAAVLASASLLATPYLFVYDLTHLSIAIAFLVRYAGLDGLSTSETIVLASSVGMILLNVAIPLPFGALANLLVAGTIAARAWPFVLRARMPPRSSGTSPA